VTEGQEPFPTFDDAAVRRATRRGLSRSAFRAAVLLVIALFVLRMIGGFWGLARGREDRFKAIAAGAFVAAHPEFDLVGQGDGPTSLGGTESYEFDYTVRNADRAGSHGSAYVHNDVFGTWSTNADISYPSATPLGRGEDNVRPEEGETRRLLAELPRPVVMMAVIETSEPMSPAAYGTHFERYPGSPISAPAPVYLQSPYDMEHLEHVPRLTWPSANLTDATAQAFEEESFAHWARRVHASDDRNLRLMGLPSAKRLHALAKSPKVYAFIVQQMSTTDLKKYLDDPAVRSVRIVDIAFRTSL
jgi:hypothetical protein